MEISKNINLCQVQTESLNEIRFKRVFNLYLDRINGLGGLDRDYLLKIVKMEFNKSLSKHKGSETSLIEKIIKNKVKDYFVFPN